MKEMTNDSGPRMRMITGETIKETWQAFQEDKAPRLASAIAYSAVFSMAPLFILCIAIGGFFLGLHNGGHGHHIAESALIDAVARDTGTESAGALQALINVSFNKPRENLFTQSAAWIMFVVGAMGFFGTLQDALNSVWNIEKVSGGLKQVLRDRLVSCIVLIFISFLILLSLASTTIIFPGNPIITKIFDHSFMVVITTIAFCFLFKILPDVKIQWNDVVFGSFVTALLFVFGELLLAKYFILAGITSSYGPAGSLLVLLIWVYYSAMILLLGAEFTKVRARGPKAAARSTVLIFREIKAGEDPRKKTSLHTN